MIHIYKLCIKNYIHNIIFHFQKNNLLCFLYTLKARLLKHQTKYLKKHNIN